MNEDKLKEIKSALELSPDNALLLKMYFDALKALNYNEEAENIIGQLNKLCPENTDYHLEHAELLYQLNKISKGILILEHIIANGHKSIRAFRQMALFHLKENNKQAARRSYDRILDIDPDYEDEELDDIFYPDSEFEGNSEAMQRIQLISNEAPIKPIVAMEKPNINFENVGGMKSVKEDISMKIINPLKHADLFKQYGKKIGGGILLYGPPGCGKTHIARATAGEIDSAFIPVGISDILDMYLGQSEKQLHQVFEYARQNNPSVLFFDEVDALGANRNDMRGNAGRNIINQFLQELDGVNDANDGILVLGATNAPWYLDNAFKRPGRFDQIIFIPPPDVASRQEILEILVKDKPKMEVNIEKVAKATNNYTGADLKAIVDATIEEKLKQVIKTGKETPIKTKDFLSAIKKIKPSSTEWFETAKNYAIYSNQGGQYDDILEYLKLK